MTKRALTTVAEDDLRRRLWWLVAGRAAAGAVLLAGGLLSARERAAHALATDPRAIAEAAMVLLLLSIIYALVLRFSRLSLDAQAGAQFFCDVITVTWLVGSTDELHTPFVALYVVVISLASI